MYHYSLFNILFTNCEHGIYIIKTSLISLCKIFFYDHFNFVQNKIIPLQNIEMRLLVITYYLL